MVPPLKGRFLLLRSRIQIRLVLLKLWDGKSLMLSPLSQLSGNYWLGAFNWRFDLFQVPPFETFHGLPRASAFPGESPVYISSLWLADLNLWTEFAGES